MTVGRVAPALRLCRFCRQFVWPHEQTCNHCQSDLAQAERDYLTALALARAATARLEAAIDAGLPPGPGEDDGSAVNLALRELGSLS